MHRRSCGELVGGGRALGRDDAARLAEQLRGRTREGRPTVAAALAEHEQQVRIHTESHRNVLRRFASHPFVLVRGASGTGKTVLAVEAVVQYASLGQRALGFSSLARHLAGAEVEIGS